MPLQQKRMNGGTLLGYQTLQRISLSSSVILVKALSAWTDENFGFVQGLCISFLIFTISTQLNQEAAQPRLLKRVTLLYCNQQIRKLIDTKNLTPTTIFSDILLAIALAVMLIMICDRKNGKKSSDLRNLLEGLLYLYSDTFDFAFKYGVLKITLVAFGISMFLKKMSPPTSQIQNFCWKLATIISVNLLSGGTTMLLQSSFVHLDVIQCLASAAILRLLFPSMESYLTYIAALRLMTLAPGLAPLFFCSVVWLDILPISSRSWVGETCFMYVIASISNMVVQQTPFWGMILVLVLGHYIDYIVQIHL
jgi:hypothetical protein